MMGTTGRRRRRRLRWSPYDLALIALVVVGAVAAVGVYAMFSQTFLYGIPLGGGSATITWHSLPPTGSELGIGDTSPPQPFAGTIAGLAVRGDLRLVIPAGAYRSPFGAVGGTTATTTPDSADEIHFDITGTLGTTRFTLIVDLGSGLLDPTTGEVPDFVVDGRYGSEPVQGTLTLKSLETSSAIFSGSVGELRASVKLAEPLARKTSTGDIASATFTVSH
jgi:hypothetical protein